MLTVIMLAACCQSPLEKLQYEVTALRAENTALKAMVYGPVKVPVAAKADKCTNPNCCCENCACLPCNCANQVKAAKAVQVATAPATVPASDFTNPTWHYPPGTTMVRDPNGVLVPSHNATHISYPGGPMQPIQNALPQHRPQQAPQFYQPTAPSLQPGFIPFTGWGGGAFYSDNCRGGR